MERNIKICGLITARKNSVRVPKKNILELNGKPLILYTVDAAIKSEAFEVIVLSTDCEETIKIVQDYTDKIKIPFTRPSELAEDDTPHFDVVKHAIGYYKLEDDLEPEISRFQATMILQPTSPLRQYWHIQEAVKLFKSTSCDSVLGVTRIPNQFHPERTFYLKGDKLVTSTGREVKDRLKDKDFTKGFRSNAAIYLFYNDLLEKGNFYGDKVIPYIMEEKYSVDINNEEDFKLAEKLIKET